jgi:hypothetical protein
MKAFRAFAFSSLAWVGLCLLIAPWVVRGDVARTTTATSGGSGSTSGPVTVAGQSGVASLGSDVVTNGTFTGNATGWTLGGGGGAPDWAYNSNNVTHANGGGTTALSPSSALTIAVGERWLVKWTISNYVAGTLNVTIGGASISAPTRANGSYQAVLITTTTGNLLFTPTTTLDCTLDTISAQKVTPTTAALTFTSTGTYPTEFRQGGASLANFFLGQNAGASDSTGSFNLGLGHDNLNGMMTGVGDVAVGSNALEFAALGSFNIAIGTSALRSHLSGNDNVAIGSNALTNHTLGASNVAIGKNAGSSNFTGTDNVLIGLSAGTAGTGSNNVLLGSTTDSGAANYCFGIGYGATCTASNQGLLGGASANAGITDLYVGQGVTKGSPAGVTIHATGGTSSDNAGGPLTIAAGISTGAGAPPSISFQTSVAAASSSTAQTLIDRHIIRGAVKSVTDNSATNIISWTVASGTVAGGTVNYCIEATDGTDFQEVCGVVAVACVNKGGTISNNASILGTEARITSTGTLTTAFDFAATSCTLRLTANTSLASPSAGYPRIFYTLTNNGTQAVAPQ